LEQFAYVPVVDTVSYLPPLEQLGYRIYISKIHKLLQMC